MYGYAVFEKIFWNVTDSMRILILKNIFSIETISDFNILVLEKKICFRIFVNGFFFQFVFDFQENSHQEVFLLQREERLKNIHIFVHNYVMKNDKDYFDVFIKILLSNEEGVIYSLFPLLL